MYFYVYARPHMEKVLAGDLTPARLTYAEAVDMAEQVTGRDRRLIARLITGTARGSRRTYIATNGRGVRGYIVQRVES